MTTLAPTKDSDKLWEPIETIVIPFAKRIGTLYINEDPNRSEIGNLILVTVNGDIEINNFEDLAREKTKILLRQGF